MPNHRVPVFRLFQPTWSEPAYYVMREVAVRMVRDRAATCINRGKAIRLTFHRPENLRDESARVGPATMHAYACGSRRAFAAVEGWSVLRPEGPPRCGAQRREPWVEECLAASGAL